MYQFALLTYPRFPQRINQSLLRGKAVSSEGCSVFILEHKSRCSGNPAKVALSAKHLLEETAFASGDFNDLTVAFAVGGTALQGKKAGQNE
ncbi:MAG: hypothetical protein V4563_17545 [Pseudomonadota bacterium]